MKHSRFLSANDWMIHPTSSASSVAWPPITAFGNPRIPMDERRFDFWQQPPLGSHRVKSSQWDLLAEEWRYAISRLPSTLPRAVSLQSEPQQPSPLVYYLEAVDKDLNLSVILPWGPPRTGLRRHSIKLKEWECWRYYQGSSSHSPYEWQGFRLAMVFGGKLHKSYENSGITR